jgi:hypothetical protein
MTPFLSESAAELKIEGDGKASAMCRQCALFSQRFQHHTTIMDRALVSRIGTRHLEALADLLLNTLTRRAV